jgi:hypothetical protein
VNTVYLDGDPLNYLTLEQLGQAINGHVRFLNNSGREVVRKLSDTEMQKYERAVQDGYVFYKRDEDPVINAYWQYCTATGRPHIRAQLGRKYAAFCLDMMHVEWELTANEIGEAAMLLLEAKGRDSRFLEASSRWCESDSVKVEEAERVAHRLFEIAMKGSPIVEEDEWAEIIGDQ